MVFISEKDYDGKSENFSFFFCFESKGFLVKCLQEFSFNEFHMAVGFDYLLYS